jgi:hypothetical protein
MACPLSSVNVLYIQKNALFKELEVKRNSIITFSIISVAIFTFCQKNMKNESPSTPPVAETKQKIKKVNFIPPADSLITSKQMKNWLACNSLLDSLAIMYADSFKTESAQTRLRIQEDYSAAQDKICVVSGLPGGYTEYKWIMENIGNPKNKGAIEAAHASDY